MGRTIKTRHIQKDIKVLDKTVTAAEHMKGALYPDKRQRRTDTGQGTGKSRRLCRRSGHGKRGASRPWNDSTGGKTGEESNPCCPGKGQDRKRGRGFPGEKRRAFRLFFFVRYRKDLPAERTDEKTDRSADRSDSRKAGRRRKGGSKERRADRELPKQTVKTIDRGEKTIKTAHASIKTSGKAAVKGTGRTIKTAQRTGYTAVRTTEVTARAAGQGARAAVLTTQRTALAARQAAITAAQAAKAAAKAVAAAVKAVIASTKALVSAILAGGWIVVLILLIVILFGALFSMVGGSNSSTVTPVSAEVEAYEPLIRQYARQYGIEEYVELIKAVMMQESGGQGTDPMQASECGYNTRYPNTPNGITDPEYSIDVGIQNLAACLREAGVESPVDMNNIKLALQGYNYGNGYISWAKENYGGYTYANAVEFSTMMAEQNGWSGYGDTEYVSHVLRYYVFGRIPTGTGSQAIVQVALTQEGNGGDTYWSWYGFTKREEWCACFVSWCADQCGYIEAGVIPKFSLCSAGMEWFESRGQFMDGSYVPTSGDLVFFDWGNDGSVDHVGIVESVVDGTVYTIEGNSGDKVARRSYPIGYAKIVGYGVPAY